MGRLLSLAGMVSLPRLSGEVKICHAGEGRHLGSFLLNSKIGLDSGLRRKDGISSRLHSTNFRTLRLGMEVGSVGLLFSLYAAYFDQRLRFFYTGSTS